MRQQIESRLGALKAEYQKGQAHLQQLQLQVTSLQETMLRISGAIMVLEEILSSPVSVTVVDKERTPDVNDSMKSTASAA